MPASTSKLNSYPASATRVLSPTVRPCHVKLFLSNLCLLDLDQRPDWPCITLQTFAAKDSQQNQKLRIRCAEWALFRLFELWDQLCGTAEVKNRLQPFFPPLEPLQSLNLRAALFRCLSDLKRDGALGRDVLLRKTMLDECKGDRFEELLALFSTSVLKETAMKQTYGSGIVRKLATCSVPSQHQQSLIEPLLLAHQSSLAHKHQRKHDMRAQYKDFEDLLRLKQRQLARRSEQVKLKHELVVETPDIPESEAESLRERLQNSWIGDADWLDMILHGHHGRNDDTIFSKSFDVVWRHVEDGNLGDLEAGNGMGLLEGLEARVRQQRARMAEWKEFQQQLVRESKVTTKLPSEGESRTKQAIDLDFGAHRDLVLGAGDHDLRIVQFTPLADSSANEYGLVVACMKRELAEIGKSRSQHTFPSRKASTRARAAVDHARGSASGEPSVRTDAEDAESANDLIGDVDTAHEVARPNKGMPDGKSETESDGTRSLGYLEAALHIEKPLLDAGNDEINVYRHRDQVSTATRPSVGQFNKVLRPAEDRQMRRLSLLDPKDEDLFVEQIVASVADAGPSPEKHGPSGAVRAHNSATSSEAHLDPVNSPGGSETMPTESAIKDEPIQSEASPMAPNPALTLIERTRQSMSTLPPLNNRRPSHRPKATQPTNLFITPKKQGPGTPDSSKASTPRDELFSQEADYASVFKSRPKIKMSPVVSPDREGKLDDIRNLSDSDDMDPAGWASSPLGRMGIV